MKKGEKEERGGNRNNAGKESRLREREGEREESRHGMHRSQVLSRVYEV